MPILKLPVDKRRQYFREATRKHRLKSRQKDEELKTEHDRRLKENKCLEDRLKMLKTLSSMYETISWKEALVRGKEITHILLRENQIFRKFASETCFEKYWCECLWGLKQRHPQMESLSFRTFMQKTSNETFRQLSLTKFLFRDKCIKNNAEAILGVRCKKSATKVRRAMNAAKAPNFAFKMISYDRGVIEKNWKRLVYCLDNVTDFAFFVYCCWQAILQSFFLAGLENLFSFDSEELAKHLAFSNLLPHNINKRKNSRQFYSLIKDHRRNIYLLINFNIVEAQDAAAETITFLRVTENDQFYRDENDPKIAFYFFKDPEIANRIKVVHNQTESIDFVRLLVLQWTGVYQLYTTLASFKNSRISL